MTPEEFFHPKGICEYCFLCNSSGALQPEPHCMRAHHMDSVCEPSMWRVPPQLKQLKKKGLLKEFYLTYPDNSYEIEHINASRLLEVGVEI